MDYLTTYINMIKTTEMHHYLGNGTLAALLK